MYYFTISDWYQLDSDENIQGYLSCAKQFAFEIEAED